ncbi:MAG: hypothetical protein ACRD96_06865, partial [Bryobacteraceae bacterium]
MTWRAGTALFLAMAALFLIANRGAYEGFFFGDDLDNLSWTRDLPLADFAAGLLTPRLFANNFRPVGHFLYRVLEQPAGLDYRVYVAVIHGLHFVNVWLVWRLARQLGAAPLAASAGTLVFAFHMALFDAYWKPMYLFDLLCALFSLASLLLYARRRYVACFVAFWLAYKSKELAVMLPAELAAYEWWFGERNWKRLAPFAAVSLCFGAQALSVRPASNDEYTLRLAPWTIWKCVAFYSSQILLVPFAGLFLVAAAWLARDRRVRFGLTMTALLLAPLLLL